MIGGQVPSLVISFDVMADGPWAVSSIPRHSLLYVYILSIWGMCTKIYLGLALCTMPVSQGWLGDDQGSGPPQEPTGSEGCGVGCRGGEI